MTDKIEQITIQLQKRYARARGTTSSESYNDTIDEISNDFANFNDQWNNRLVPLTDTLPDGTVDSAVDAFANGLAGTALYVDASASSSYRSSYYNTIKSRPNTIYEQLSSVYTQLDSIQEELEERIDDLVTTAAQVAIVDGASIYSASNVENALAEVMAKVNLVTDVGLDLSSVTQHYLPATDIIYDIGSSTKRMRAVYVGPSSLHINSKASDAGVAIAKIFSIGIAATGKLYIKDGSTTCIEMDDTGIVEVSGVTIGGDLEVNGVARFDGDIGLGTDSPTEALDIDSDAIRVRQSQTPASAGANGNEGMVAWDTEYLYVCVSGNGWKRAVLSAW